MKTVEQLYELKLGETCIVSDDGSLFTTAVRVPGGWLMRSIDKGTGIMGCAFVPFDNEFMPNKEVAF